MKVNQINSSSQLLFSKSKSDSDEMIVRKALLKVWIRTLEEYAQPGAHIPPVEEARRRLLEIGEEAGIKALCKEHWYLHPFMVRDKVHKTIECELHRVDLQDLLNDVRESQSNPALLQSLKDKIHRYVIGN